MANDDPFLFYSALYGRPVLDPDGNAVGRLDDLAVTLAETFPAVTALLIRRGRVESFRLTARWRDVESLEPAAVRLRVPVERLVPGRRLPSEPSFWVGQVLLDRQIVDTSGAKVVRVNDLHFLRVPTGDLHLVHVDVGCGIPLIPVMYLSQVANGVLLPVVLVFMLLLINRRDLMGQYTNGTAMNAAAWVTVIVTSGLSLYLAVAVFFGASS